MLDLAKDAIDLGIVIQDSEKSLAFYRDLLGMEHVEDLPVPGDATMHRLQCGNAFVKLVKFSKDLDANPPGGIGGATGYRYFTIQVNNIDEIAAACEKAGHKLVWPVREIRPGTTVAMVEDPDGNWVEFVKRT